jgi:AcrR family transcriptional regulator
MENEKELRVLEAAKTVFLRHGFRRVTMQDVADEAGISRPALYLIYPNKEEIFLAAIRNMTAVSMRAIREGLAAHATVESKLQFTFEVWTVRPFQLMLASPDAKDLIDCVQGFARETFRQISSEFEALLVEILAPLAEAPLTDGASELGAGQIAHLLNASIQGLKESAASVDDLRSMISGLIMLTVAAMRSPASVSA